MAVAVLTGKILQTPEQNKYEVLDIIARGGSGTIWRARNLGDGNMVAIKIFNGRELAGQCKTHPAASRFAWEIKICAQINHPFFVKLLDSGVDEYLGPFAVFEYLEGETLKNIIEKKGALPVGETIYVMGQLLEALIYLHSLGIVHRDLKPENIVLIAKDAYPPGRIKVIDFGISAFTADHPDFINHAFSGSKWGSPAYCAPEQLRDEPPAGKSDIYAWGLILLECLCGKPAIKGNSIEKIFSQQLNQNVVPLPPFLDRHPAAALLKSVLHKNAQLRIDSAACLYEEFNRINWSTLNVEAGISIIPSAHIPDNITITYHSLN